MTTPSPTTDGTPLPTVQRMAAVLWPSFLTAGVATVVFFTLFDPLELGLISGLPVSSRLAGYSFGFLSFWLLTASSCALTCYFQRPCPPRVSADRDAH